MVSNNEVMVVSTGKANHLYWLGRYSERVFTTLRTFFSYYDSMIDGNTEVYKEYCDSIGIPCVYFSKEDFVSRYIFDKHDENSLYSNLTRAYDNAVVIRSTLSSESLAYIEMALNVLKDSKNSSQPLFALQSVIDYLLAFWGSADDFIEDDESRNIMKAGRYVERIDLYIRLKYPKVKVLEEYRKLLTRLHKIHVNYDTSALNMVSIIINNDALDYSSRFEAIDELSKIVKV
ncbi:MAG: alpha-E domain-containing protein [Ruminococcus sp.]|nr:alpha-E domain-containing protein [Ruminococcus sp.]MCD7800122.1 alpha-E domain-containing protein [Ruminococcus sp.]